ncbi:rust resistance kinase Lr10-like [Rhododendron vialii]|uniref:rust resistance kinase Lr10-like n=1 Tax=Rhododendron vialii TaxID=182163 RepID=UPI00265F2549|nr:rust resistance kinase Lr10-like [Rhododendron vialii]
MFCGFMSNSTSDEFECFKPPKKGELKRRLVIASVTLGSFWLLAILIAMYWFHRQKKIKREYHLKIERFLEDYKALKPARYSYVDIKKITNQFKDKVGQGGYGTVYRGQLSNDVHVAFKILNNTKGNGEEFINEVGIIGTIHHVNVVRLVGYCADGFKRALIYEFLANDSLEKFAISNHDKHLLGWKKLLEIAMGIAKGIEYLHQGCDQQILHFDTKPHNILLDENLNPKITDFGLAKLCSKEQSVVSMTTARGTIGYIAPEVFSRNFGSVSYKSDIYSFGMLLLEMVGGKKNFDVMVNSTNQIYFPEWIYNRLDSGEELRIRIQDEGDAKIAKKLAIVGLWCIQWYPVDRPSKHVVIQMLEGDGDTLIKPPNPFVSANPPRVTGQASRRPHNNELETLVECE